MGVGWAIITDKYVFTTNKGGYYVYDIEKNAYELMSDSVGSDHISVVGNYAYFSDRIPIYDDTGEIKERVWHMYRYDLKTKKLEKISSEPVSGYADAIIYTDSEIYWNIGIEYYVTDYDFENRREWSREEYLEYCEEINTVGGYTLDDEYGARPENGIGSGIRIEIVDEAGGRELIAEYSAGLRWDNIEKRTGFMYTPGDFIPNEDGIPEFMPKYNKLVYVGLADRSKYFEIDLPENLSVSVTGFMGCRHYVGEYTSLEARIIYYDENGEMYFYTGIFVLNTQTGENFVITDESKKYNRNWEEI